MKLSGVQTLIRSDAGLVGRVPGLITRCLAPRAVHQAPVSLGACPATGATAWSGNKVKWALMPQNMSHNRGQTSHFLVTQRF